MKITYRVVFFFALLLLTIVFAETGCKSSNNSTDLALQEDSIALSKEQKITEDSLKAIFLTVADSINKKTPKKASILNEAKDLEDYLPYLEELQTSGKPKVEQGELNGSKFVQVTQLYKTNKATATITIIDYGNNSKMYAMATAVLRYSADNQEGGTTTEAYNASDPDLVGRVSYNARKRESSALIGVANRFFISAQATNQNNTNLVKLLLDNIDLDAMKTLEEEE